MVSIKWPFKAKLEVAGGIHFRGRGRVSMHTNTMLNNAPSLVKGIEAGIA